MSRNSSLNLYITEKQEKRKMQIILQNGFLTFVRRYCGQDYGATEIFNIIHDYFFETKEVDTEILKDKLQKQIHITEGIFLKSIDQHRLDAGLLDDHEKIILFQKALKQERIINSVKLFREMLIENNIPLYQTYQSVNTINQIKNSTELFLTSHYFYEILMNNFESMYGATIKYIEEDLNRAIHLFFKEFSREDPTYAFYRQDEDVDIFFKLYVWKEAETIFSIFKNPNQWSMKGDEDNDISKYLQDNYNVSATNSRRFWFPSLNNLHKRKLVL